VPDAQEGHLGRRGPRCLLFQLEIEESSVYFVNEELFYLYKNYTRGVLLDVVVFTRWPSDCTSLFGVLKFEENLLPSLHPSDAVQIAGISLFAMSLHSSASWTLLIILHVPAFHWVAYLPGCCVSACPAHFSHSCYCLQTTQAAPQLTQNLHLKKARIHCLIDWSADRQLSSANNFQVLTQYKGAAQLSAPKTLSVAFHRLTDGC